MKKKFNLCGIFATMFVAAIIFSVSSCSQDDDYYESDMYTMAEPLETRAGLEPSPGGGNDNKMYEATCTLNNVRFYENSFCMGGYLANSDIYVNAKWRSGGLYNCVKYISYFGGRLDSVWVTESSTSGEWNGLITVSAKLSAKIIVQNDTLGYDTLILYANKSVQVARDLFQPIIQ